MEYRGKIRSFTDLVAWKEGHQLVLMIYQITNKFPPRETYGLASQMQRCAVSITSNIAEGFSRHQLLVAKDIGYISKAQFNKIAKKTIEVSRLLTGLRKSMEG